MMTTEGDFSGSASTVFLNDEKSSVGCLPPRESRMILPSLDGFPSASRGTIFASSFRTAA